MRENLIQTVIKDNEGKRFIPNDWYDRRIPENVQMDENVYLDSTFGFSTFNSKNEKALKMGFASSSYDRATFVTTENGQIVIGDFSIVNGCTLICSDRIKIGKYVMIAWGAVICDNYLAADLNSNERAKMITEKSNSEIREMPFSSSSPITIEDNVWIGFDAVVKPGTVIGRGSVIGSMSVVSGNVPPYSLVVGNPGRVIKKLEPTDKNFLDDCNR